MNKPRAGTIAIAVLVILIIALGYTIRAQPARYGEILGLDEFYMYRVSKLILDNGLQLPEVDVMRNYPYGDRQWDYRLQLALPAYVYILLTPLHPLFGATGDFKPFALLYPAIMAIVAIGAAYFAGKEMFRNRWSGLFAAFFVAVIPGVLTRTAAGGIEKEASAFPFIFLSVWFFAAAYNRKSWKYGILAGVATGLIGSVWGGVLYFYVLYGIFSLILLLLNKETDNIIHTLVPTLLIGVLIPQLQPFHPSLNSFGVSFALGIAAIALIRYAVERFRLVKPEQIMYVVPGLVVAAGAVLLVGSLFSDYVGNIISNIVDLLTLYGPQATTVAESIAGDWNAVYSQVALLYSGSPIPLLAPIQQVFSVWLLMFTGALLAAFRLLKKDWFMLLPLIWLISGIYSVFYAIRLIYLFAPAAAFLGAYSLGWLMTNATTYDALKEAVKIKVFYGVGGALVLIGLLSLPSSLFTAQVFVTVGIALVVLGYSLQNHEKGVLQKVHGVITANERKFSVLLIPVLFVVVVSVALNTANGMAYTTALGPSINEPFYQAMEYLRTQTPKNASVISWWDFGYWFQTVGERPSIADGGGAGETSRKDLANWFTANADNWTDWDHFIKNELNVGYILMDYTLPGKYGAITKIESDGTKIVGFLQFDPRPTSTVQRNNITVSEFSSGGPYTLVVSERDGGIADSPQLLVSQGNIVGSRSYVNHLCTAQGIIPLPPKQPELPGCVALTSLGLFFVPAEAEFTIFSRLMFMDAAGLPLDKVFDNQLIKIYKVRYENESNPGAGVHV